jgi:hypothetical protein
MSQPDEFSQKMNISWGLLIWAVGIAGSMGFLYASMIHNDNQSQKNSIDNRLYTEQEVGGLRSDWERQNNVEREETKELIKRIESLEKYHKQ